MSTEIEHVRGLLLRAIAEKGEDYVYPLANANSACLYFEDDGQPSCIVGHVLHYMGESHGPEGASAYVAVRNFGWSNAVREGLLKAQRAQDDGRTWGEALAEFDRAVELAS